MHWHKRSSQGSPSVVIAFWGLTPASGPCNRPNTPHFTAFLITSLMKQYDRSVWRKIKLSWEKNLRYGLIQFTNECIWERFCELQLIKWKDTFFYEYLMGSLRRCSFSMTCDFIISHFLTQITAWIVIWSSIPLNILLMNKYRLNVI